MTLESKHSCSKNDNVYLFLLSIKIWIFAENILLGSRPGYTTFTSVMLYSDHHARGMDTIPCGIDKRSNNTNVKQTKCWDNAIGSIGKCNSLWCYWCSSDRGMSTYLEQFQTLENLHKIILKLRKQTAEDKSAGMGRELEFLFYYKHYILTKNNGAIIILAPPKSTYPW